MIIKLTEPKTAHSSLATDSYWVAAYNYIRFKYQRQDAYYVSVTNDGGVARFDMSHIAVAPGVSPMVGDVIYVSGPDYGTTCIITAIDAITVSGSPSIGLVTDLPYNGNATGFVNCLMERPNWLMEVNIKVDTPTGFKTIANSTYRSLPDGTIWVEVQEFLKSYLNNNYEYFTTGFNAVDDGSSIAFIIEHRQVYEGYTTEDFVAEDTYYATNAAMQANQPQAPNMVNHVVFDTANNAKFLCGFKEPTMWVGYPFTLSFINYENGVDLSLLEAWYDINRTQVDVTNQGVIAALQGSVNLLAPLRGVVTSLPYSYMSVALCESVFPYHLATENKIIRAKIPCGKNEVMLVWRNQLGGWDYYLFDNRHTSTLSVSNGNVFEPWVEDLANVSTQQNPLTKTAFETIQLAASSIDQNDVEGIKGLLKSIAIYIIETDAPHALTRVTIEPGTWQVSDTKSALSEIEFTIRKPEEFLQHE
ncbi:MAG: hypothetical protein M0D57_21225 [Sphingobacteriales bacterium JAD_PAG50586_3]|nr:MAG: hypothetical protein M0D57_21225 [Sphingobacteriales bacterium JAD_PAG50586_3]